MRKYFSWIPNALTLTNLLCGSIAITELLNERYASVLGLVVMALLADFLDGFVARRLKVQSMIGKDLDSLADLVSFGLLPSLILFHLAEQMAHSVWNYLCFSGVIFSAIRLARFNHDMRQSYYFIGLPTPANALLILSLLVFILYENPERSAHSALLKWNAVFFYNIIYSAKALRTMAIVSSFLLVFPVYFISLKVTKWTLKETLHQQILLIGILLIMALFGIMGLFWAMIWYLVWSVLWYYFIR